MALTLTALLLVRHPWQATGVGLLLGTVVGAADNLDHGGTYNYQGCYEDASGEFVLVDAPATQVVDVTDAESAGRWRELLGGAGVQRAALSGSGIFKDAAFIRNMK